MNYRVLRFWDFDIIHRFDEVVVELIDQLGQITNSKLIMTKTPGWQTRGFCFEQVLLYAAALALLSVFILELKAIILNAPTIPIEKK